MTAVRCLPDDRGRFRFGRNRRVLMGDQREIRGGTDQGVAYRAEYGYGRPGEPMIGPPRMGGTHLLVHGHCSEECGWWCAMPEGSRGWPRCPICGEQVWPDGKAPPDVEGTDARNQYRRDHGTGFLALYVPEIAAAELLMRAASRR